MRGEAWRRFVELLDEGLELEPGARAAWLGALEGDDAELGSELAEWLADERASRGFLDAPLSPGASWDRGALAPLAPGDVVGRYTVVRAIGVGGTSVVYEAEQEAPRRRVALKVFREGLAGDRSRERFAEEAAILAGLEHPGLAAIHEAGVDGEGDARRPWIAMELVRGALPVTLFARRARLDRRGLLELFLDVCDAVAHGHERGVIHRDLKPDNILVDAAGRPKVIDFGVARVVERASAASARTATGAAAGTLPWMSPERLTGPAKLPDTRADVYALGVVLHELLCGELPVALDGTTLEEALRAVSGRGPVRLAGVDRDLEAIVDVSIAVDPGRRYASAAELAADLRRYLAREPVVARRPSLWHHARLAVARRRRGVAVGLVGLGLVAAAAALGAIRAREVEARERAKTAEVLDFLQSVLALASPSQSPRADMTMREVLDDAARRIESELADAPDARAQVHALVGSAWRELGRLERAEEHLRAAAADLRTTRPGSVELAGALSMLSEVLLAAGRGADAEEVLLEARELYGKDSDTPRFFLGIVTNKLAGAKRLQGDLDAAERLAHDALLTYRDAFGPDHVAVAGAHANLAEIQLDAGSLDAAESNAREALRIRALGAAPNGLFLAQARVRLGKVLVERGRADEALPMLAAARDVLDGLLPDGHRERDEVRAWIARCGAE